MWAPLAAELPELRFVVPDLRGYGDEPLPRGRFSYVEDVAALLDDGEPPILMGASFGGLVAIRTALAYPERVRALVLAAPSLPDWEWSEEVRAFGAREEALFDAGDLDAATQLNVELWVSPDAPADVKELVARMQRRAFELQADDEGVELEWPEPAPLAELRLPVLVVLGGRDVADFRSIAGRLASEAPGVQVETIEDAAHLPSLERPEEFARLVRDFLSALPA